MHNHCLHSRESCDARSSRFLTLREDASLTSTIVYECERRYTGTSDPPTLEADDDEDSEDIEDIVSPTAAEDEEKRMLLQRELERQQASGTDQHLKRQPQHSESTQL